MKRVALVVLLLPGVTACTDSSPVAPSSARASTNLPTITVPSRPPIADAPVRVEPASFELDGQSQTVRVEVIADSDVEWTITSDETWMTAEPRTGRGRSELIMRIDGNLCTGVARTGHLRVEPGNAAVKVWQDGSDLGICDER